MKKISDFLEKFAGFGEKEKKEKELIIDILRKVLNVEIKKGDLEIKDLKINIKVSGPQKTEIILNKNKILFEINQNSETKFIELN